MSKRNIGLGREQYRKLKNLFPDVSRATINNALNYKFDSQLASKIRCKAKLILEEHAEEVKNYAD